MNENVEFQDVDSAESKYDLAEEYARNGDEENALELLRESADGGYAEAMYAYGRYCLATMDSADTGLAYLNKAVENGHVDALVDIGEYYEGIAELDKAKEYYTIASELGNGNARIYLLQMSPLKDNPVVRFYMARMVKEDSDTANNAYILGCIYDSEYGSPSRKEFSRNFLKQKSIKYKIWNDADALCKFADAFAEGEEVEGDYFYAIDLYERSAMLGNTDAMFFLAMQYLDEDQDADTLKRGLHYLLTSASRGRAESECILGELCRFGRFVQKDLHKAFELWKESAEGGNAIAMYNLGIAYLRGDGTEKDREKAKYWFEKAAELEHKDSAVMLALLMKEDEERTCGMASWLAKLFNFSGCATRKEFWCMFAYLIVLFVLILYSATVFADNFLVYLSLKAFGRLFITIPLLGLFVRRLRDIGKNGWWSLLMFTGVGIPVLLWWSTRPSVETEIPEDMYIKIL